MICHSDTFDILIKIDNNACYMGIVALMEQRLEEYKRANPDKDVSEKDRDILNLINYQRWALKVWEEALAQQRKCLDLEFVNLKLMTDLNDLKKENETLKKQIEF